MTKMVNVSIQIKITRIVLVSLKGTSAKSFQLHIYIALLNVNLFNKE
jgi:hypothetical protein